MNTHLQKSGMLRFGDSPHHQITTSPNHISAFTLIELVLVMLLITVTLAMVAPSFQGWSRGGRLRDAADQFQAATLWAQSQAAADAVAYYLKIDPDGRSYELAPVSQITLTQAANPTTQKFNLPEHLTIELINNTPALGLSGTSPTTGTIGGDANTIRFSPTGSTTPAQVRITADWGESVELVCESAIAVFQRVKQQ